MVVKDVKAMLGELWAMHNPEKFVIDVYVYIN